MRASSHNHPSDKLTERLEALRVQMEKMRLDDIREANAMLKRLARRYRNRK